MNEIMFIKSLIWFSFLAFAINRLVGWSLEAIPGLLLLDILCFLFLLINYVYNKLFIFYSIFQKIIFAINISQRNN